MQGILLRLMERSSIWDGVQIHKKGIIFKNTFLKVKRQNIITICSR